MRKKHRGHGCAGAQNNGAAFTGKLQQAGKGFIDKGRAGNKNKILFRQNIFTGGVGKIPGPWLSFQNRDTRGICKEFFKIEKMTYYSRFFILNCQRIVAESILGKAHALNGSDCSRAVVKGIKGSCSNACLCKIPRLTQACCCLQILSRQI